MTIVFAVKILFLMNELTSGHRRHVESQSHLARDRSSR